MPAETPEESLRELLEGTIDSDDTSSQDQDEDPDDPEEITIEIKCDPGSPPEIAHFSEGSTKYCSVMGCTLSSSTYSIYRGTTYHLLPRDPVLRKKWIDAIGGEQYLKKHDKIRICSFHFRSTCFNRCGTNSKLKPQSIPSINIPFKQVAPSWPADVIKQEVGAKGGPNQKTNGTAASVKSVPMQPHWAKPIITKVEGIKISPPPITRMITRPKSEESHLKFQLEALMKRSSLIRADYEKQLSTAKQSVRMLKKKVSYQHKQIMALKLRMKRYKEDRKETRKMEEKSLFMYKNGRLIRMEFNETKPREGESPGKKRRGRKPKNYVPVEEEEEDDQICEYTIETAGEDEDNDEGYEMETLVQDM